MSVNTSRIAYNIEQAMEALDLSRQSIYDEINEGRLRTFRVGRRRLVSAEALTDYVRDREAESVNAA